MCGIVAMISKKKAGFLINDGKLFEQMLYADALRGMDSTGIYGVNKHGNLKYAKAAKPAADFIKTKTFEEFKSEIFSSFRFMVGHNRAATRGATTDENAHPFVEDHICLIHNGTLTNHKELANTDVDSHAICHAIAKEGYMKALSKLNGAYALIWYDALEKKLHIARNTQRPLWLVQTPDADYIASEPSMLIWLLQRVYGKVYTPVYFKEDHVYIYNLDNLEKSYEEVVELPKKALPVITTTTGVTKKQAKKKEKYSSNVLNITPTKKDTPEVGDTLFFSYESSSIIDNAVKVIGKWTEDGKTDVVGYINVSNYSADELEYILESATMFYGKYLGDSKAYGKKKVMLSNTAHPVMEYETLTNITVTDKHLIDYGHCCDECGNIVDPDVEEGEFWVRFGGTTDIKGMLCSSCVEKHTYLSKTLENKRCTKESSSSVTSLVPLQ